MRIRGARAGEAAGLTGLVMRSKAHWGYDAAFLDACRAELAIEADDVVARRIVVAEDPESGEVFAVASLEGQPPVGELGLLFVEPRMIRRGVGRTLYADVLARARDLGFQRLTIDSDPYAEPFYRALGATPGGPAASPLVRLVAEPVPLEGWVRAWTGGRRAVHVGNVAEFQGQFTRGEPTEATRRASAHYACLAAFASPYPAALVLPGAVPGGWIDLVSRQLAWAEVEVYDGLGTGREGLGSAVLARPALVRHLRGLGLPFVPWGHTARSAELSGERLPPDALRYESKQAANALFRQAAPGHPGIAVPDQWAVATRRAAARLVAARARSGAASVVKTEHGAGGSGTRVVTSVRALPGALRRLPRGPVLVEEYISGGAAPHDLTYDGLVDADGAVHDVGAAVMDVSGTAYLGATVGPGAVPEEAAAIALPFGRAVGRALAAAGYRGWYDVDFVTAPGGRLAPTEVNLRLTGPSAAFMVKARLDETRGGDHLVRAVDYVPLGARLPEQELTAFLGELVERCAPSGAVLVPAIPTAAFDPAPYLGVLLAARTAERLDAAEALVRGAGRDLGGMFGTRAVAGADSVTP